ncbi:MAG: hypothetical protein BV456_11115 [Thermoplasmata archaeon M8B2D]|nr:MAG: hypothetical protein BV456_11115 [Thermoplasmata archaeon M8B2D]
MEGDELVHLQFQKFSKGEFRNRALLSVKKTGKKYTINTSAEFANELVRAVAKKLGQEKTRVTGAIVSTSDLKEELEPNDVKQFQGVKRYLIDKEMSGTSIIDLLDRFPKTFFALSFSTPDGETMLKIKPKAPKSGKPGKGDEAPKADFCKLVTTDEALGKEFVFETDNFKKANIIHHFFIDEIKIPDSLKDEKDYAKIREGALRKGRILREAMIDEKGSKQEKNFEA